MIFSRVNGGIKMNAIAENILYIYLIVFTSVLIFDIVSVFYKRASERRLERTEFLIEEIISDEDPANVSESHKKALKIYLKKINYFIAFSHVVDNMEEHKREMYLSSIRDIFNQIYEHYSKQEIVRQTYFVHFLAQYPFIYERGMKQLITYIINCTTSESVYLRENALNTLYRIGDESYLKEAFYYMNYLGIAHHHKLITDGLLRYNGDSSKLIGMLLEEMDSYNENYKVACISYFAYKKVDCTERMYEMLTDSDESKEARIACIRYFANVNYEPVVEVLRVLLEDDKNNWEYSAVVASTLGKYPSKKTTEWLMNAVQSHNWYVRNNAASSLIQMTKKANYSDLIDRIDDKYAKEAIEYQLHLREEKL